MTKLTVERRVKRETLVKDRTRPIIVELFPHYCAVRVKGERDFYPVPWDAILDLGRKLDFMSKVKRAQKGAA